MKKTLIALLALAGVAAAADSTVGTIDTIEASWGTIPEKVGDFWAGDYTLTFTLNELYTLEGSGSVIGFYRGSGINDTYGYNAIVLGGTNEALTLTIGRGRAYDTVDNATGISKETSFTFASAVDDKVTFTTTIQKGVTYTLSVKGGNQAMTPTLTWAGGSEVLTSYKGNMNSNAALTCVLNTGTIPEPTTATLSLLALAGLAARRRRK